MEDTLLPDLDDYDFVNDLAFKEVRKALHRNRKLTDFYKKRAILHGKTQASLTNEVYNRMLD